MIYFLSYSSGNDDVAVDKRGHALKNEKEVNGICERLELGKGHQSSGPHLPQDSKAGRQSECSPRAHISENGLLENEAPHGSVTGSNGFVLAKQQPEGGTPHRTSGSPVGGTLVGHAAKTLPPSSTRARNVGSVKTDGGSGMGAATDSRVESETKNGTSQDPPPVTIHRARKTMARPASNQPTLKVTPVSIVHTKHF